MIEGLSGVLALDRRRIREQAVVRFGAARMVDEYIAVYRRVLEAHSGARRDDEAAISRAGPCSPIFAHPDDESLACGGTLARLADDGVRVVLLCASHGERGQSADPALAGAMNSAARASTSCTQAAKVLGIADVILLDHPDGEMRWANVEKLHEQIVQAITVLCARRGHHLR